MKRILIAVFLTLSLSFAAYAGSDGQNELSKNKSTSSEVKDCFEEVNRGIFALTI